MKPLEIKKDIFWVGAVDWQIKNFHGHTYTTQRGTTYNAYLILDEKVALVDTVFAPYAEELVQRIKEIIPLEKIDYIIANHVETDHSGALPEILKTCPKAKVVGTNKCKEGLWRNFYLPMDFQTVKTNDRISLGKKTLNFIEAPMIHWPDSMFTYCPEEKILLPNDAFGQHYASSQRFDDEVDNCILMDEAAKYYANILWPLGPIIWKKLQEIKRMNLAIDMIAPSHGIIWRREPAQIINAYERWSQDTTSDKVVVVYETMWQATAKMARKIVEGIAAEGLGVKLFDVTSFDRTEIIKEMLEAKGFVFGSSTHDSLMLPTIAGFLEFLKGLKPKGRLAAVFGSYGWQGQAAVEIENVLKQTGIDIVQPSLTIQYQPHNDDLEKCFEFGRNFALKVKNSI